MERLGGLGGEIEDLMDNIHILFFHGKGSKPETSSTAKAVKEHFKKFGVPVFVPDYKPDDQSIEEIENGIKVYIEANNLIGTDLVVMGISRGGYWALKTANGLGISSCVILNPALNTYGEETGIMPRKHNRLNLSIYCHLNDDDELLDSQSTFDLLNSEAKVTRYPAGGHRMKNIQEVLNNVTNDLDRQIPLI